MTQQFYIGVYTQNTKSKVSEVRTPMFIAAVFTRAKMWKQQVATGMSIGGCVRRAHVQQNYSI